MCLRRLTAALIRLLLRLRYRLDIHGLDCITQRSGVLILANHPAEIDPVILGAILWPTLAPHAMVVEDFFYARGLHWFMRFIGAIPIPNMEGTIGGYRRRRVEQALEDAAEYLRRGENVLIYPAGRLMRDGVENLRAASGVRQIVDAAEVRRVLLVRSRGLLGSSFSWLRHRRRPDLRQRFLEAGQHLLLNGFFFAPRREVLIEIEEAPADFPFDGDKMDLNAYLETWFNARGEEPMSIVPDVFWRGKRATAARESRGSLERDQRPIPASVREKVLPEVAAQSGRAETEIGDELELSRDLGLDSLAVADLLSWLADEFRAADTDAGEIHTVRDLLLAAVGPEEGPDQVAAPARPPAPNWHERHQRPALQAPDADQSIPRNFLAACDRYAPAVAIADDSSGVLRYVDCKRRVLLLADLVCGLPPGPVGILLPASAAAPLVILAVLLAGRVAVLINWTVGDSSLEHALELSGVGAILSSGRFLDRVDAFDFELIADRVYPLEDLVRDQLNWQRALRAWWRSRQRPERICEAFGGESDVDAPAVILFTSGSETAPKGVPLTHRNIVSNIASSLAAVPLESSDVLYGFLPPFHSFGLTVTSFLPLLSGLKTAFYPNPTAARKLAMGIARWRPTVLCGTPTFLAGILQAANVEEVSSLHFLLTGAEKAPAELFERAKTMCGAELLEGYGITECSPVVTINEPGGERIGVGKAVPGVRVAVVDLDSHLPVPAGQQGLILVTGDNVFQGYLKRDSTDAFVEREDGRWYNTGDLGYLDAGGSLVLTGRLKRFVKVGGEMLSLPAMEEAIQARHPEGEFALCALERDGNRPELGLFSTLPMSVDEANSTMREAGFSNLARVHHLIRVAQLPLLGSGKTDYRTLSKRLAEETE